MELQSHATLAHVVNKLPHTLRSRWAEYSYAIMDRLPDLSDLDNWLDNCAMAEYCVRAGSERTSTPAAFGKDRQEQKGGKVIKPKVFTNSAPGGAVTDKKCAQCENRT